MPDLEWIEGEKFKILLEYHASGCASDEDIKKYIRRKCNSTKKTNNNHKLNNGLMSLKIPTKNDSENWMG